MKTRTRRPGVWPGFVIALIGLLAISMGAGAVDDPASDDGVMPQLEEGNFSCSALNSNDAEYPSITSDFGFKIDGNPSGGTYYLVAGAQNGDNTVLTGGAPTDSTNSVTVTPTAFEDGSGDTTKFDWAASLGIDAVIVKAQNSYVYVYTPEDFADGDLQAPGLKSISHIEFCYDYELTASKTASAAYTRTYTWDIDKDPDGLYKGFIGDLTFNHNYTVKVDQTVTDSDFVVSGTITVNNPTPFTVGFNVADSVGFTPASVSCPTYSLTPGASTTCTYSASLASMADGINTATITSTTSGVGGASATASYAFGDPTTVVGYPTINVTDTEGGALGSASGDKTFTYSKSFQCPAEPSEYTDGVYVMEQFVNTATITETGQSDSAKVDLTCYAPVLAKTADTSWEQYYGWTIDKKPDGTYSGFIGDPAFDHTYTVTVDQTITDQNFLVSGTISVTNPTGAPGNMTVSLADEIASGVYATVDCDPLTEGDQTQVTVASGTTENCSYSGYLNSKTDGTNTATGTFNEIDFTATAGYAFGDPKITGYPTINVTDTVGGYLGSASDDKTFTYDKSFQCPAKPSEYTDGKYVMKTFINTATITETKKSDSAKVDLTCYAPVLAKTATTSWEQQYDWTIDKSPNGSYTGFIGDPEFDHTYTVTVDQTITDQNFLVSGTISVTNPTGAPGNMTVSLADEIASGVYATVDCDPLTEGDQTVVTVAPGATEICSYSGYLGSKTDGTNTATGTFNGVSGFTATAGYTFGEPTIIGYPEITVTDTEGGALGSASGDQSFTYSKSFLCPADPSMYTKGTYVMEQFVNTATITETGQSDQAKVDLTCYAPIITKDASASYDERHAWDVDKTVDPESQGGFAGQVLPWTWTVTVTEDYVEENFLVSGTIFVGNPALSPGDMTVSLVDQLNDGTFATVDCDKSEPGDQTSITVKPGAIGTCAYTAKPNGRTATENKATGTFNGVDGFEATATVTFEKTVVNGTATVTDDEIGLDEVLTAGDGPWTFTKGYSHTCSTNRADYFVDGVYTQGKWTVTNWAYVYSEDVEHDRDDATTTYTCDASFVNIYKTTNGAPADSTKDIGFTLYDGNGTKLEDVSTLGNGADIRFATALVPGAKYSICENPVPAGFTFEITVNGGNVLTYAGDPTGQIQCFDFTAEATGTTVTFEVENRYPGGAPRTPGYWKNWSSCSGGNQAETAAKLGGVAEGVFILDDLLPQTIGKLVVDSCEDGVNILGGRDLNGGNKANDAAYALARTLLAARLNQDAGACVPPQFDPALTYGAKSFSSFEEVLDEADVLLTGRNFTGLGDYLGPKNKKDKALASYALWLSGIIDDYNNSLLCTGDPSH